MLYTSVTLHSHNQKTYQHQCNTYPMTRVTCIQTIHENKEMIWVLELHKQNSQIQHLQFHHAIKKQTISHYHWDYIKRLTTSMSYPSLTLHPHNQKTKNIDVVAHQSYYMHIMKWQKSLIPWHHLSLRLDRTIKRLTTPMSHPSFTQSKD